MFCYAGAETVVSQFARKSASPDEAWRAKHGELYEYIPNTQKAADWDALRLQLAIGGALTTRILYLPTNALVSSVAAYGPKIPRFAQAVPEAWKSPSAAHKHLATSPLVRMLKGEQLPAGKRRSGPAAGALEQASAPFATISRWVSGSGPGSDKRINAALAKAIAGALREPKAIVEVEQPHPWIPNVIPDIRVEVSGDKITCIEMGANPALT